MVSLLKLIFHVKGDSHGPEEDENETNQRNFTAAL